MFNVTIGYDECHTLDASRSGLVMSSTEDSEDKSLLDIAAISPLVEEPCKKMLGFYLGTGPDKALDHAGQQQPKQPTSVSDSEQPEDPEPPE